MKEIRRTEMVERITFVATDGTVFNVTENQTESKAKSLCEQHERAANKKLVEKLFNDLKPVWIDFIDDDERGLILVKVNNFDEWKKFSDFASTYYYAYDCNLIDDEPKTYPAELCYYHSCACDYISKASHCIPDGVNAEGIKQWKKDEEGHYIRIDDDFEYIYDKQKAQLEKIAALLSAKKSTKKKS